MFKGKNIIAIIPARGGSKGLPRKNIAGLRGKPLVAWTIEEALKSRYLDKIIVSTDNEKIAAISEKYGAIVPFLRPRRLSDDDALMIGVIGHALTFVKDKGEKYDIIVLLQPTSPARKVADIDGAIETLFQKKAESIVSVCENEHHPYRSNMLPANGSMKHFLRHEIKNANRQDFPKFYRLNGAVYVANIKYLEKQNSFFGKQTFAYVMPIERSVDIDSEIDMKIAEVLMRT